MPGRDFEEPWKAKARELQALEDGGERIEIAIRSTGSKNDILCTSWSVCFEGTPEDHFGSPDGLFSRDAPSEALASAHRLKHEELKRKKVGQGSVVL